MLVFLKHRLVVFSTPKCGSTALEQALAPASDIVLQGDPRIKHCTFHRYKWRFEKFLQIFDQTPMTTAALIRHPQDWLGSWYRYRHGSWLDGTPQSTKGLSFDEFVEGYLAETQPAFAAVGSQARFLTHPKTGETVDHLYCYDGCLTGFSGGFWRFVWARALRCGPVNTSTRIAADAVAVFGAYGCGKRPMRPDFALYGKTAYARKPKTAVCARCIQSLCKSEPVCGSSGARLMQQGKGQTMGWKKRIAALPRGGGCGRSACCGVRRPMYWSLARALGG